MTNGDGRAWQVLRELPSWPVTQIPQPPGAREPGGFDRVGALEAALRGCVGLPPVS